MGFGARIGPRMGAFALAGLWEGASCPPVSPDDTTLAPHLDTHGGCMKITVRWLFAAAASLLAIPSLSSAAETV